MDKAPTRAFSWLKMPTSAFTFKNLLRHYAVNRRLNMVTWWVDVKLGHKCKDHKGWAALRIIANLTRPL